MCVCSSIETVGRTLEGLMGGNNYFGGIALLFWENPDKFSQVALHKFNSQIFAPCFQRLSIFRFKICYLS